MGRKKIYPSTKEGVKIYRDNKRRKAMNIISNNNISCINCNCDKFELLEINHKNGGGREERRQKNYRSPLYFYNAIINGERSTDDLDILCKICNTLHYISLKHKGINYQIIYNTPIKHVD